MKGGITLRILEAIKDGILDAADIFDRVVTAGSDYNPWRGYNFYRGDKRAVERATRRTDRNLARETRHRYYSLFSSLKRDGLIRENIKEGKKIVALTSRGKERISNLKRKLEKSPTLPDNRFKENVSNTFVVVTFDIPEGQRRKRNWLRSALKNIGLKFIQKSVWVGKVKVPEEFLDDLRELKLTKFVEIFEINKKGSLEHIL